MGHLVSDRSRVVNERAELSAEPELVFVSYEALSSNRVRLTESKSDPSDFIEIVGAPDMVCEIVSDSSVKKDTVELFNAYYQAGIAVYWLADGRRGKAEFTIYHRGQASYEVTKPDSDGFARSTVLGYSYRLARGQDRNGMAKFRLEER